MRSKFKASMLSVSNTAGTSGEVQGALL